MAYLHNDREQLEQAVNLAAYQTGIMAQAIEKDYYVTMILRLLSGRLPFIVFKGGTSLLKCHKVINRFSEDIDITTDISISQGQKIKLKNAVKTASEELGLVILNIDNTRSRRDYNKYEIAYNTVLPLLDNTLQPQVLLETSFTTVSFPTVLLPVSSYLGQLMETEAPEAIMTNSLDPFEIKVQGIDRTLADKVFAICDYYLGGMVKKHSRHLYDIYKLLPLVLQDDKFKQLVFAVREARKASPVCLSAQDEVDVSRLLKKIIKEETYKSDYVNLTEMLLDEYISYETAIEAVENIANSSIFSN